MSSMTESVSSSMSGLLAAAWRLAQPLRNCSFISSLSCSHAVCACDSTQGAMGA